MRNQRTKSVVSSFPLPLWAELSPSYCSLFKGAALGERAAAFDSPLNLGSTLGVVLPGEGEPHDHRHPFRDAESGPQHPLRAVHRVPLKGSVCSLALSHKGVAHPAPKCFQNYLCSKSALLKYKFISWNVSHRNFKDLYNALEYPEKGSFLIGLSVYLNSWNFSITYIRVYLQSRQDLSNSSQPISSLKFKSVPHSLLCRHIHACILRSLDP